MSYIGHQCTRCHHPDIWRPDQNGTRTGRCDCGCRCTPGPSTVRPSWDTASRPVERILRPGDKLGILRTYDCGDCTALYEREPVHA